MTVFGALFLKNQEKQRCLMRLFLKKSRCYSNPIILIYIYIYTHIGRFGFGRFQFWI